MSELGIVGAGPGRLQAAEVAPPRGLQQWLAEHPTCDVRQVLYTSYAHTDGEAWTWALVLYRETADEEDGADAR